MTLKKAQKRESDETLMMMSDVLRGEILDSGLFFLTPFAAVAVAVTRFP